MCINTELEELVENFKQLPELYRHGILGIVRERRQLYELQVITANPTLDPQFQYWMQKPTRDNAGGFHGYDSP